MQHSTAFLLPTIHSSVTAPLLLSAIINDSSLAPLPFASFGLTAAIYPRSALFALRLAAANDDVEFRLHLFMTFAVASRAAAADKPWYDKTAWRRVIDSARAATRALRACAHCAWLLALVVLRARCARRLCGSYSLIVLRWPRHRRAGAPCVCLPIAWRRAWAWRERPASFSFSRVSFSGVRRVKRWYILQTNNMVVCVHFTSRIFACALRAGAHGAVCGDLCARTRTPTFAWRARGVRAGLQSALRRAEPNQLGLVGHGVWGRTSLLPSPSYLYTLPASPTPCHHHCLPSPCPASPCPCWDWGC